MMTDYRLYCLDGTRKIGTGEWMEAATDDDAIVLVRAKNLALNCELWDQTRLVSRIPARFGVKHSQRLTPAAFEAPSSA
jgi:hypothetical protein